MELSFVLSNGVMPSYYAMTQKTYTSLPTTTDTMAHSPYATHCNTIRAASSQLVITSSVMGPPNSQAKPLLPCTCVTNYSYIKVVQCKR